MDELNSGADLWVWNLDSGNALRLTGIDRAGYPVWSPDDTRIAFSGGTGNPLFGKASNNTGMIGLDPDATPEWLVATEFTERNAVLSPDGRWMAYQSDESGQTEVYVRPFPNADDDLYLVSTAGGHRPLWSPVGDELFFLSGDRENNTMMSVAVETGDGFSAGVPRQLMPWPYWVRGEGRSYDVSSDGQRFLTVKALSDELNEAERRITVVLNWTEELKRLAPVP